MRIAVISDTHGPVRPDILETLKSCNHIIHAGDIGSEEALKQLRALAPLTAIRGNVDCGPWAEKLPLTEAIELKGKAFYIVHDIDLLDIDPEAAGFDVVVSGHSHKPDIERKGAVTYINPGSIGPRRFMLPIAYATITINGETLNAEIQKLD